MADEMTKGNFSGRAGAHVANVTRKWREEAREGAKKTETERQAIERLNTEGEARTRKRLAAGDVAKADNTIQYLKRIKKEPWKTPMDKPVTKGNFSGKEVDKPVLSPVEIAQQIHDRRTQVLRGGKGCGLKPGTMRKAMDFIKKEKENPSWKAAEGKIVSMIEGRKK